MEQIWNIGACLWIEIEMVLIESGSEKGLKNEIHFN